MRVQNRKPGNCDTQRRETGKEGILNKDRRIVNNIWLCTAGELNLHQATLNKKNNQENKMGLNATKILNTVFNLKKDIKILTAKGTNFPK